MVSKGRIDKSYEGCGRGEKGENTKKKLGKRESRQTGSEKPFFGLGPAVKTDRGSGHGDEKEGWKSRKRWGNKAILNDTKDKERQFKTRKK